MEHEQTTKKAAPPSDQVDYGPWIPNFFRKMILMIAIALIAMTILVVCVFNNMPIGIACIALGFVTVLLLIHVNKMNARFRPGSKEGLSKLHHFLLSKLAYNKEGTILDFCSGNGELAIRCALRHPDSVITASDHWNRALAEWGYSKWQCEQNARIESVLDNFELVPRSGTHLPFSDETFDAVVGCFVHMDVNDDNGEKEALLDAFRVLKKGGSFSIAGMFKNSFHYGDADKLVELLKASGVEQITYDPDFPRSAGLPSSASLPLGVAHAGLIYGIK